MNRSLAAAALVACAVPTAAVAATTLSMTNGSVVETDNGTVNLEFFITRSGDLTNDVNVGLFTVDPSGNAIAGDDYVPIPFGTRVVMPAGSLGVLFNVQVRGDTVVERNESFTVALNSAYEVDGAARTLAPVVEINTPTPLGHAVGDVDGDSRPDLVFGSGSSVVVRRNTSTGEAVSFGPRTTIALGGTPVGSVAVADFDGDGLADVAASRPGDDDVQVLRSTSTPGSVSFATPATDLAAGDGPGALAIGDYNNDGDPDIWVANNGDATLSVFVNTSVNNLSFNTVSAVAAGAAPVDLAVADLDGDGLPEAITAHQNSGALVVRRNLCCGNPAFAAAQNVTVNTGSRSVAAADVDGDGVVDLAVNDVVGDSVEILRNTTTTPGTITFAAAQDVAAGDSPGDVDLRDLDGDDLPEIVAVANASVHVLGNDSTPGTPAFLAFDQYGSGGTPSALITGDVNGDGFADVLCMNVPDNEIGVLRNKGTDVALAPATFTADIFNNDAGPVPNIGVVTPMTLLGLLGLLLLRSSRRRNTA